MERTTEETKPLLEVEQERKCRCYRRPKCCSTIIVEPVMFLFTLAEALTTGSNIYLYDRIAESLGIDPNNLTSSDTNGTSSNCGVNKSDPVYIQRERIQDELAKFNMIMDGVRAIPVITMTIFWGSYSDMRGRKLAFLSPVVGGMFNAACHMVIIWFNLPIYYFIICEVVTPFFGSSSVMRMTSQLFISESVNRTNVPFRIFMLSIMNTLASVVATLGVGYWIKSFGFFWQYVLVIAAKIVVLLYIVFCVPETVKKQENAKIFTLEHFRKIFRLYTRQNAAERRWKMRLLTAGYFAANFVSADSLYDLLLLSPPLCFDSVLLSWYKAASNITTLVGGILGNKLLFRYIKAEWLLVLGKLSGSFSETFTFFVQDAVMMYIQVALTLLGPVVIPMYIYIIPPFVEKDERGALFSTFNCIEIVGGLVSGIVMKYLYTATLDVYQGRVTFLINAFFNTIGVGLVLYYIYRIRKTGEKAEKPASIIQEESHAVPQSTASNDTYTVEPRN